MRGLANSWSRVEGSEGKILYIKARRRKEGKGKGGVSSRVGKPLESLLYLDCCKRVG